MVRAIYRTALILVLAVVGCSSVIMASSPAVAKNEKSNEEYCRSEKSKYSPRKLVLSINAANGKVNWDRVNALVAVYDWEVQELVLDGFGTIMREESFHAALEHSYPILKSTLESTRPDALLVASKGIGVIAYLASKNLWIERPVILLSPVPNPIPGLVDGSSYESEWNDTISIMRQCNLNPILVAVGSSSDEEMLISEATQDTSCGKVSYQTRSFENCKGWRHVAVEGDHAWKNVRENERLLAKIIDYTMFLMDKARQDRSEEG
uniref:Uncharacterized protein n=1 Tax=Trieres chinensis TaxID=1514140 RepID=A0A7S1Z3A1_TRICV|mmetsp:Transcript_16527/g.33859  ORF Transcript_16527/g.33859 Transcript_16527/m.33859 type:complete len:265 (+) Transcript_16527:116-910(+)